MAFVIYRPPTSDQPVALYSVARRLREGGAGTDRGPQSSRLEPAPVAQGPPGEPPAGLPPDGRMRPPGGPPMEGGGPPPDPALSLTRSLSAPAPSNQKLSPSGELGSRLARLLGADPAAVLFFASPTDQSALRSPAPGESMLLRESFVAAERLADGSWSVVEREVEGFPNALHRRALLLFVLGAATLLPLASLFARALSAPIRRFSEAARRLGRDPNAPPLPREGPAEMLMAVDSFNIMQAQVNRLIQERTHMVGAIAHDLRTPLTRLAFRIEDFPGPAREKIDADINEMKSMISAALDFIRDRSSSGQREQLDFRLLVESIVDDQGDLGHDVTLQSGAPITLSGNRLALRRMVGNLIDNALKYGHRARLRLRVMDGRCILDIDDDGPGIPGQLQQQVFEPFFRLESSRNRDTGGIGLGLATVRAIALDHGGEIELGNRKDGGLRVTISLPVGT